MYKFIALFLVSIIPALALADKKPEPVECVQFAKTWDDAIEEAKFCNIPIVIHSHGFT